MFTPSTCSNPSSRIPKHISGAAEKMSVKPKESGLVAAHLNDLNGAKVGGFYTICIDRPLEEKSLDLREKDIPDTSKR